MDGSVHFGDGCSAWIDEIAAVALYSEWHVRRRVFGCVEKQMQIVAENGAGTAMR